ncbi:MAG: TnpV protein [Oscillospiraceae bacterium]|nr:TnpV protein [Oscillospiraceae bacterium]
MTEILTYSQVGDYLLPNLALSEPPQAETAPLGRYGRMRKAFLKDHRTINYNRLLLMEKLYPHLREIDEAATTRLERLMTELTARTNLPDKSADPMAWTTAMNALKAQAEEMVANELIYS